MRIDLNGKPMKPAVFSKEYTWYVYNRWGRQKFVGLQGGCEKNRLSFFASLFLLLLYINC